MTLRSVVGRLATTSRRHGVGAGAKFLALAAARKVLVIERSYVLELTRPPSVPDSPGRRTRLATADDIRRLGRDPTWDLDPEAASLLERGHRCVLNCLEGEIAGYAWMNPHRMLMPRLRTALALRPGEVHIYKGFSHPHHRGKDLGVDRFAFWLAGAYDGDKPRRLLTDFAFDNFSTLARANRTGLVPVGEATYLARGAREWRLLSTELVARATEPIPPDLAHRDH